MKNRRPALLAGAVILLAAGLLTAGLLLLRGHRPFRGLKAAEIASASVHLTPPDVTIELDRTDIETLAALLREVRVTRRDGSYTEYDGQGVLFTLSMADGTTAEIAAYNPFLVVGGVGYRTAYEPCEALNRFANGLLTS